MSDNPFVGVDSERFDFIKQDYETGNWYNGKSPIDVNYMMVDPDTIKMGWIWYENSTKTYHEVWQKDIFTPIDQPSPDYKPAFSVWDLPWYKTDESSVMHHPMLWKRNSHCEYKGFMNMGASYYEKAKENPGKLPIVRVEESELIVYKSGFKSYSPTFKLATFKERPSDFVIPSFGNDETEADFSPDLSPSASDLSASNEVEPDTKTFDDDIPF